MNASEGLRRIAVVIRWTGVGFAGLSLLLGGGNFVSAIFSAITCKPIQLSTQTLQCASVWESPGVADGGGALLLGIGAAAFFVYGARATAWIIEGFAAPRT